MKLKSLLWIVLIVFVSACSSAPSTPPLNIDNDFWLGELTRSNSTGTAFAGFGFRQTGSEIEASLVISNGTEAVPCCILTGSLNGRDLELVYTEPNNDSVAVSGTFDSDTSFTGTLRFIIEGETDEYSLQMSYDSELDAALFAQNVSGIKAARALLE